MRNKIIFCVVIIFSLFCIKLCAQESKEMTKAQAKTARDNFVAEAKKYVGCPYEFGAVGPDTFDCSGLIYYVARKACGIQLPRTAKAIYNYTRRVPDSDREIGDLLFFKTTTADTISHVGIYIGNNQFISAISDGQNTGVIISSLKQDYWKGKYVSTGQFLPSANMNDYIPEYEYEEEVVVLESGEKKVAKRIKKDNTVKVSTQRSESFVGNLVFDLSTYFDWSLFSPKQFMFRYRGIDVQTNVRYAGWNMEPGIGLDFRFNSSQNIFQIPVLFSGMANDYIKVYAGPVISFKPKAELVGTEKEIKPSFFPGIIGVSVTTPALDAGGVKLQLVQDISYTVFNNLDNSALSFVESVSSGLVMYTGIKISLPMSLFL